MELLAPVLCLSCRTIHTFNITLSFCDHHKSNGSIHKKHQSDGRRKLINEKRREGERIEVKQDDLVRESGRPVHNVAENFRVYLCTWLCKLIRKRLDFSYI